MLGSGLANCTGANQKLQWNSSTNLFSCANENVLQTRSFNDPADVTWTDDNVTEFFTTPANRANITPTSASNSVLVMVEVEITSGGNNDTEAIGTIRRGIGSTPTCVNPPTNQVDGSFGKFFSTSGAVANATLVFLDSPASTSNIRYTLCSSTNSTLGSTPTKTDATITLIEVTNSTADLAEIYSTNDKTIAMGDVVSLDSALRAGVKKTSGRYDSAVLGVVSTAPALTIGGITGEGVSAVPVALSGRVPVKVSAENGAIKAGDYLTASSIPGVAMRATKAGAVIGNAMSDFNGEGVGVVLVFVKNGESSGSKLAEVMKGIDTENNSEVLRNLILEKEQIATGSANVSEILTDRVVAGLEVITPKVTTQDILATGMFVMQDKDGNENVKITSDGNAIFMGTIKADKIIANEIQGFKLMADSITTLSDKVAGMATASATATEFGGGRSSEMEGDPSAPATAGRSVGMTSIIEMISKAIAQIYTNTAEFFGKVIFHNDVAFLGRPTFNRDTAGFAIIKGDSNEVEVKFEKVYANEPVVTISMNITGDVNISDMPTYVVADVNTKGFKIRTSKVMGMDIRYSWMAIAVEDGAPIVSQSHSVATPPGGQVATVQSTETRNDEVATPSATPTVEPTPTSTDLGTGLPQLDYEVRNDGEASGSGVVE